MINFTRSNFFYDPFPHCILEEFLDNSIYEEICKEYPDIELLDRMSDKTSNDNKFIKYNFSNSFKNKKKFLNFIKTTKATKNFYQYINSNKFINVLNSFLLNNFIDIRLNTNDSSLKTKLLNKILKRELTFDFEFSSIPINGGYILPHTDGGNKILGFIIPIIDNDEILKVPNIGTKILKAKSNEYKYNFFNKTVPFDETELVKEIPFKKNQMSVHVKTFNSLHAVGPIVLNEANEKLYRKSISIFLIKK